MKNEVFRRFAAFLAAAFIATLAAGAEQVKSFNFSATTKSDRVTVTINDNEQVLEHLSPSREVKYAILDYDVLTEGDGNRTLKATVLDPLYNTAFEVLLYAGSAYSDIRIGRKRLTFNYVTDYRIVK